MKITPRVIIMGVLALLVGCTAITQVVQSPLGGIAVGPAGLRDVKIYAAPYCCPSTALEVRAKEVISELHFQWVNFGFNLAREGDQKPISGVEVCYEIKSAVPGRSYISQTRLTDMTTPNVALVRFDDGTDRTDLGPQCYTVDVGYIPQGATTLALKVVIGDLGDSIIIGSTRLLF